MNHNIRLSEAAGAHFLFQYNVICSGALGNICISESVTFRRIRDCLTSLVNQGFTKTSDLGIFPTVKALAASVIALAKKFSRYIDVLS